jgi:hypothetical protein
VIYGVTLAKQHNKEGTLVELKTYNQLKIANTLHVDLEFVQTQTPNTNTYPRSALRGRIRK